jgi:hypothetical protein
VLESNKNHILPPSSLYAEDGDEAGYRPDGPDSFGLPVNHPDDLYSASPPPRADAINYGAEFHGHDDVSDRGTDLQAALAGMDFGTTANVSNVEGGQSLPEVPEVMGGSTGRTGRRTMDTIEE